MRHKFAPIEKKWVTQDEYSWRCAVCNKPANRSVEKEGKEVFLCPEHLANDLLEKEKQSHRS